MESDVRVFVSYAHEGDQHIDLVRQLWILLRSEGIDARLDLPASERRQDWTLWMMEQVREADYVLIIASPNYRMRAEGRATPHDGRGVQFEAALIRDEFYRSQAAGLEKFLPVVLPGHTADDIPAFLSPTAGTFYRVNEITPAGIERLYRVLTGQPWESEPPVGRIRELESRPLTPGPVNDSDEAVAGLPTSATSRCGHTATEAQQTQDLYDFAYIFTRVDQLETGAWGASVAPWMTEIGRHHAGFKLHEQISLEGGIETTATCCTALTAAWSPTAIGNQDWARRARSYFRKRQSLEGSIGYRLPLYKQDDWSVQTTLRHTALGSISLAQLGETEAATNALRFVMDHIDPSGDCSAANVATNCVRLDNHPSMLMASTLRAVQLLKSSDEINIKILSSSPRSIAAPLLLALSRADEDHYPFFKPYGSLAPMKWYTFLSVLDLIAESSLSPISDRIADGLADILSYTRDGGLPFWEQVREPDYGLTSLLLGVLRSQNVLDVLNDHVLQLAKSVAGEAESWLTSNLDKYLRSPRTFAYTQSGTVARLLRLPQCGCLDATASHLTGLDNLSDRLRASYAVGESTTDRADAIRDSGFLKGLDASALAALFDEKAFATDKRAPTTIKSIEHTSQAYGLLAKDYTRLWASQLDEEAVNTFLRKLAPHSFILDAGCGPGQYTRQFVDEGHESFGVDITGPMLAEARAHHHQRVFVHADVGRLPFRSGVFDAVWAFAVMIHVPRELVPEVLGQFNRVLRAGGTLYVNVQKGMINRIETPAQFDRRGQWGRFFQRYESQGSFEALLTEAGFVVDDCAETTVHSEILPTAGTQSPRWMKFVAHRA